MAPKRRGGKGAARGSGSGGQSSDGSGLASILGNIQLGQDGRLEAGTDFLATLPTLGVGLLRMHVTVCDYSVTLRCVCTRRSFVAKVLVPLVLQQCRAADFCIKTWL